MLRPWNHSRGTLPSDGEGGFRLGDVAWRRSMLTTAPCFAGVHPALTLAQRRKLLNLYVQLTGEKGEKGEVQVAPELSVSHVVAAFARIHQEAAGLPFSDDHALVTLSKEWFAQLRKFDGCGGGGAKGTIAHADWLPTCAAMLDSFAGDEFPEWLLAPHREQFRMGAPGQPMFDEKMTRQEWIAWRLKVQRFTPAQMSRATRCDGWGSREPSLEEVFKAADRTRQKPATLHVLDQVALVKRWWSVSDAFDELNAYGL